MAFIRRFAMVKLTTHAELSQTQSECVKSDTLLVCINSYSMIKIVITDQKYSSIFQEVLRNILIVLF